MYRFRSFLFFLFLGLLFSGEPKIANAQTPIPPNPSPTAICYSSPTPTSIIPTPIMGTPVIGTPVMCGGVGETPSPCTVTPTLALTGTPTMTTTPTITPTSNGYSITCVSGFPYCQQISSSHVGLIGYSAQPLANYGSPTGVAGITFSRGATPVGTAVYYRFKNITVQVMNTDGVNRQHNYYLYSTAGGWLDATDLPLIDDYYSGPWMVNGDVQTYTFPNYEGVFHMSSASNYGYAVYINQPSSATPNWRLMSIGVGAIEFSTNPLPSSVTATPTVTPTSTPSLPPCGIETGGWITPPYVRPGACYTLIPGGTWSLPDVSQWIIGLPTEFTIPGFTLCVDYLVFEADLFGVSWLSIASTAAFMFSLTLLYREFRS
jgi:hypothetical protein